MRLALHKVAGLVALVPNLLGAGQQRVNPLDVPLRVMTFNIAYGHGNLERTAEAIAAATPDIVALQEVDVHWSERSNFADQAALLAERLHMESRFARIYQLPAADSTAAPREFGVALLSRFPILSWANHPLTRLSTQQANAVMAPLPGFLEATIDVGGIVVRVFNSHTDYRPDPRVRTQQVTEMLALVGEASTPTLLFGDLNAPPDAPELQPLFKALRDVWPDTAGPGLTYPATAPVKRIDYVLASAHFKVASVFVPTSDASDHRPVVAHLVAGVAPLPKRLPSFVSFTGVDRVEPLDK